MCVGVIESGPFDLKLLLGMYSLDDLSGAFGHRIYEEPLFLEERLFRTGISTR